MVEVEDIGTPDFPGIDEKDIQLNQGKMVLGIRVARRPNAVLINCVTATYHVFAGFYSAVYDVDLDEPNGALNSRTDTTLTVARRCGGTMHPFVCVVRARVRAPVCVSVCVCVRVCLIFFAGCI